MWFSAEEIKANDAWPWASVIAYAATFLIGVLLGVFSHIARGLIEPFFEFRKAKGEVQSVIDRHSHLIIGSSDSLDERAKAGPAMKDAATALRTSYHLVFGVRLWAKLGCMRTEKSIDEAASALTGLGELVRSNQMGIRTRAAMAVEACELLGLPRPRAIPKHDYFLK